VPGKLIYRRNWFFGWFIILVLVSVNLVRAQIADFTDENLTFIIKSGTVEMTGSYFFANRTGQSVQMPVIYPFCVNEQQAFPDSVSVHLTNGRQLNFQRRADNLLFSVPLGEEGQTEVIVYFRQPVSRSQFEYILTSTRSWSKPLESADFLIQVPLTQALTNLSFPYERIDTIGNFQVYHLHFEDFYPDRNLIFRW
jgi:hypothetical protein